MTLAAIPAAISGQPAGFALRTDSQLVLVPVTVFDRQGATVTGLREKAFTITEDGKPQRIYSFSEDDAPVSIGIVFDVSGSMSAVLDAAKDSLRSVLKDANPSDEAFLNVVSTRPREDSGFTNDFDSIVNRIASEHAAGDTALIDTIYGSIKQLRSGAHNRRALLVVSDGMDNHSRYSKADLPTQAVEADTQVYTIAVDKMALNRKPIELLEEKRGLIFLDELAAKTGGMAFTIGDRADIKKAAMSVGQALRNRYNIGYVPRSGGRNGQWRRIAVKVAVPGMRVYARAGYRIN